MWNSGKAMLGVNFVSDINLDISFKNDIKHQGINTSVDIPISELIVFRRSATEDDINDAKKRD